MADGGIFEAKLKAYKKFAKSAKGKTLEVGFFEGSTYPNGIKVAEVAFWNEFGKPENNQPPRPFFRKAIDDNKNNWVEKVKALASKGATFEQILSVIGQDIVVDIQSSIANFSSPDIKQSTKDAKRRKGSLNADKALMDTETMYKAVQWVINDD